jgi:hypothetical protein
MVAAGALALAAGTVLPAIAPRRPSHAECGWTCYSPLGEHIPLWHHTMLWSIRPSLAVVAVLAALFALAATRLGARRAVIGALVVAVVTTVLVTDALWNEHSRYLFDHHRPPRLYPAHGSRWLVVPALGGLLAAAGLAARAQRGT